MGEPERLPCWQGLGSPMLLLLVVTQPWQYAEQQVTGCGCNNITMILDVPGRRHDYLRQDYDYYNQEKILIQLDISDNY